MSSNTQLTNISDYRTLVEFLEYPLGSSDGIMDRFHKIPNPRSMLRGRSPDRFLYIPGTRKNRVLMVAHSDTYWDGKNHQHKVVRLGDVLYSTNPSAGLGADNRAGCSIIWLLQDLGHSILITDGEERSRRGSKFLMNEYQGVADEIQYDHQFVVQLDLRNGGLFKCYNVGSNVFRKYIASATGYTEPNRYSYSDIVTLCTEIVGVNLSVGYQNEHSSSECLNLNEWFRTLELCRNWLAQDNLPKFVL